jgi:hypothetical protein
MIIVDSGGVRRIANEMNERGGIVIIPRHSLNHRSHLVEQTVSHSSRLTRNDDSSWKRPKSTMIQPFEAHWRALSNGTGARRRQAFLRRVAMKNWPFAGRKIDRLWPAAVKKWPIFQRRHRWIPLDESYRSSVATWLLINNLSAIFWRKKWTASYYCEN